VSRVGILGGTFDPIHTGHVAAAEAALECASLDRVLFVPSAQPPHRSAALAPAEDRFEMCRLAIEGEPRFRVSNVEIKRGGRSYTVDTLRELKRLQPADDLFLILGWDAARLLPTWRDPKTVIALATIVIISRPGTHAPDPQRELPEETRNKFVDAALDAGRFVYCGAHTTPDVSGSAVRRAIGRGESVAGKVPVPVERYIAAHHLYANGPDS
jgi:nicotinate-nucleotide adenylyltransferase